jgi:hypothetical protein
MLLRTVQPSSVIPSVSEATAAPFSNQIGQAISQAQLQNNQGIYDNSGGKVVDIMPIPQTISFSAYSTSATGSVSKTLYLLNTNFYTALVTNNGGGEGTIVNTYGDGFSGKLYERLMASASGGRGIRVYGYSLQYNITSSGNSDGAGLANAAFTQLIYTGNSGQYIPNFMSNAVAVRNTQYVPGLLTFKWDGYLNSLTQFTIVLPVSDTVTVNFFTSPNF